MLTGRSVLITGAARGLGARLARRFAQAGADLALSTRPESRDALVAVRARVAAAEFRAPALEAALRALADETGWKPGDLFTPVRTAVTGAKISPPLFETMELLGRDTTLARLDHAIAALSA